MKRSLALAALLLLIPSTVSAKPVISISPTAPQMGDAVTVSVDGGKPNEVWVNVRCYQGATFVWDDWLYVGTSTSVINDDTTYFAPTAYWTAGSADCLAQLYSSRNGALRIVRGTSLAFSVSWP